MSAIEKWGVALIELTIQRVSNGVSGTGRLESYDDDEWYFMKAKDRQKRMDKQGMEWCDIKVIVDDATADLFEMPEPDEDPDQVPAFHVTRSTADLVVEDFERYRPSLERMAEDWREEKKRFMQESKDDAQSGADVT